MRNADRLSAPACRWNGKKAHMTRKSFFTQPVVRAPLRLVPGATLPEGHDAIHKAFEDGPPWHARHRRGRNFPTIDEIVVILQELLQRCGTENELLTSVIHHLSAKRQIDLKHIHPTRRVVIQAPGRNAR